MYKLKMSMSDTFTMVSRSMKHTTRHVEILIVTALLPFMQLLMIVFILGGTMEIGDYTVLDYVLPGIILMTIESGASMTAISVKEDMMNGIVDRFRTIDIGKTAVLNGHMAATLLRCFLTTTLILVTAIFIGFCTNIGFTEGIATFIIIFSFIMMYTWAAILWGLVCPSLEASGILYLYWHAIPLCKLMFCSHRYHAHGNARPRKISAIYPHCSLRGLLLGVDTGNSSMITLAWCIGLFLVFFTCSLRIYHKRSAK